MNERITPAFRNLMNVAMSRAKRRLVLVGHYDYVAHAYPGGLLQTILVISAPMARIVGCLQISGLQAFMAELFS